MSFRITRAIGAIGILSFLLWITINVFTPIEKNCVVDYYGTPDLQVIAEDILDLQTSSYHVDYNYHKALRTQECLNTRFDCDVTNTIDYYGEAVTVNRITREEAISQITDQLEEIYSKMGIAELRLNWTVPIFDTNQNPDMGEYTDSDASTIVNTDMYMYLIDLDEVIIIPEIVGENNCSATFEVDNSLDLEIGDIIPCYAPMFGDECQISLSKYTGFEGLGGFLMYVTGICLAFVCAVTALALFARANKRFRKWLETFSKTSENVLGNDDDDNDDDNDNDDDEYDEYSDEVGSEFDDMVDE
jgi:hypothetical protein